MLCLWLVGAKKPVLIDGGLSTELEHLGAKFDGPLWTGRTLLENPQIIEKAHRNFISAGARVIITSSYQISPKGFEEIGLSHQDALDALQKSVQVARRAAEGSAVRVAASIGPYGAVLHDGSEYKGRYGLPKKDLVSFHVQRIEALLASKPDILLAETIPDLLEAQALAEALRGVNVPVWISFTVETYDRLWSGDKVEDAIFAVAKLPTLESIGVNCVSPDLISDFVNLAKSKLDIGVSIYPNKGGLLESETNTWKYRGDKMLADYWTEWRDLDLFHVGGCCGFGSKDISALSAILEKDLA